MTDLLTPRRRELVARMAGLGPTIAERSHRYDREASFPYENFADFREAGLLGLCIPEEYGGTGNSLTDLGVVHEALGYAACSSPLLSAGVLAAHAILEAGDAAQKQALLPSIAAGERIVTRWGFR